MKSSFTVLAALTAVVVAFGSSGYSQSPSGGGGVTSGASGGGTAGAAGSLGGVTGAGPITGAGSGIASGGAGVGTGFSGPAVPFAGNNSGFNRNLPPQNRSGFTRQNPQRFSQDVPNPFNERSLDRNPHVNRNQQGFNSTAPGSFTQGMQNQGAFGLGNGNRSSFFDNQPFNNQGFGRDAGAGAGPNSSEGMTGANDPAGFTGTGTDFRRATNPFADNGSGSGDFVDDRFQNNAPARSDQANDQDSFRGQPFSESPVADGSTIASENSSDADRGTGAGTGPNSSRGMTAAGDPPGFNGTASPLARSSGGDGADADQAFDDNFGVGSRTGAADPRGLSGEDSFENQNAREAPFNSVDGPTNPFANPQVNQGQRLGFPTEPQGTASQTNPFTPPTSVTAQAARVAPGTIPPQGIGSRGQPRGNGVFDFPPPPGVRNWLDGSTDYGFMQQYERPSAAQRNTGVRNTNEAGRARPAVQGTQGGAGSPNYFDGAYSRSRL